MPAVRVLHVLFRFLLTEPRLSHRSEPASPVAGPPSRRQPLLIGFLLLVAYLFFFHQLDNLGLVGPDEPRYAKVGREMAETGDFVTPRLHGEPWLEKPILYYWMAALAFQAFGISEVTARLPSAAAALLGLLAVFAMARHWISRRGGAIAALILASSPMYFVLARAASTDMLLAGALTLGLACIYFTSFGDGPNAFARSAFGSRSSVWVWGIYIALALALLAKGPVAVVLAGGSVTFFVLLSGRTDLLKRLLRPGSLLAGAAVAVPWYWLCYRANGWPFVQEFFINHNLERFTTDRHQHVQPVWFYIPVVLASFVPWVFQILSPGWKWLRQLRQQSQGDPQAALFWSWAVFPLVFFSLSRSKLPGYVLPAFPALAILAAKEWDSLWTVSSSEHLSVSRRLTLYAQAATILGLGFALPLLAARLNAELAGFLLTAQLLLGAVGVAAMLLVWRWQPARLFAVYLTGAALAVLLVTQAIAPRVDGAESSRRLAEVLRQNGFAGQPVFVYGLSRRVEYGLNFYLNTRTRLIYSEGDVTYPQQGELFLLTDLATDPESVLPQARTVSQTRFLERKITKMVRR